MESGKDKALHMVDPLPTHAHFNPLWIMAYDNFTLESIAVKGIWGEKGVSENAWITFYHDPFVCACKCDEAGTILEKWTGKSE